MINSNECRIFTSPSFQSIWTFYQEISMVLSLNRMIEKDDYLPIIVKYHSTFSYIMRLIDDNLIHYACNINNISYSDLKVILNFYDNIEKIVDKKNYIIFTKELQNKNYINDDSQYSFKGYSYTYIVTTIINCLIDISQKRCYGAGTLAHVLKGELEKEYKSLSIIDMKYFGKLSRLSIEHIYALIYWLIKRGYIHQNRNYMPKIKITYAVKDLKCLSSDMIDEMNEIFSREVQRLL